MRRHTIVFALIMAVAACTDFNHPEFTPLTELVPKTESVTVGTEGGTGEIVVYSSVEVCVTVLNDTGDWARLNKDHFVGDDTLRVTFSPNDGFRRMLKAQLVLGNGELCDTVWFRQEGIIPVLDCDAPFCSVDGRKEDEATFDIRTNADYSQMSVAVSYDPDGSAWVHDVSFAESRLGVRTDRSLTDNASRAVVLLSLPDGWDNDLSLQLSISRSGKNGGFGTAKTFAEVKALAGQVVKEDCYVEGIVVSDWRKLNTELNPSISHDEVDTDETLRTAYLQAKDGTEGLRLRFDDPEENHLVFGTLLSVSLKGVQVVREDSPERYTLTGVRTAHMLHSESGVTVPEKIRRIGELSDKDIYTRVTLPNTEFVWKNGALTNVYENYTLRSSLNWPLLAGNNNRFDGWATLLVDSFGNAIYAPINMLCTWRRNGSGVPQGSGNTTGVIVHNDIRRYGNMGAYQIRVLDETGFEQDWEGDPAYVTLAEWDGEPYQWRSDVLGKFNSAYTANSYTKGSATDGFKTVFPSDDISSGNPVPAGELTVEAKLCAADYSAYFSHNAKTITASGAGDRGRASAGQGKENLPIALHMRNDIKGWYRWEEDRIAGYNGIVMRVSTKGLSGSGMYIAYALATGRISAATSRFFPAHWCVEFSIDEGTSWTVCREAATGAEYGHLRALPWSDTIIGGIRYDTCSSCALGPTEHLAFVPDSVFGKDSVLFRIRPYDDVMSIFPLVWNGETETANVNSASSATVYLSLEYVYIRYRQ